MVAKHVIKEGIDEREVELPRILYTGTCRRYLVEVVNRWGKYKHLDGGFIYFSCSPGTALSYASERAIFYNDFPVVLITDTEKLNENIFFNGQYKSQYLNIGSFLVYEFILDEKGKFGDNEINNIVNISNNILTFSNIESWKHFSNYFLRFLQ